MASMVTAKMVPADDLEIPSLEPPRAFAKSKETKEVSLGLDDPSKTMKIGAHLDPKRRLLPTCQCRCVCLETCIHVGGTTGEDRALLECLADHQTDQAEAPMIHARQEGGY